MKKTYPSETIETITNFLFAGDSKKDLIESNLVIVLGNDFIEGTIAVVHEFYSSGVIAKTAKIILSGATGSLNANKELECTRLYDCAVNEYRMNKELFIKEPRATNAYQNLLYSKNIIEDIGGFDCFSNILIIGKAFLIRRAIMCATKLEYPTKKIQYYGTVDKAGRNIDPECWWKSEDAINRVMAEVERIGKYAQNGDLSIF